MEYQPDPSRIRSSGGQIARIEPGSIGEQLGLAVGDTLLAIDDLVLRDEIDYRYAVTEPHIRLRVRRADGSEETLHVEKPEYATLGVGFTEPLFDRLRTCNNKCPFCFLTQMPKGMRKTLYLKDDDYRLSFLYGNFVTFTNLSEADWQRIEQQHLSPLNMSVHATDPYLRGVMLGKQDAQPVHEMLARLDAAGIQLHTQIVACPGANDGAALHQSIRDLAAWYPTVQSISVVPVGLTKYRFNKGKPATIRAAIQVHETDEWRNSNWEVQPDWQDPTAADLGFCSRLAPATDVPLRCYTPEEAARLIDDVEPYQRHYEAEIGYGLVYPSDEFYLLCGRDLPAAATYDDFPQYSNGVGMTRDFLDEWADVRRRLPLRLDTPLRLVLVCGTLITPVMQAVGTRLNEVPGLHVTLLPVANQFFGETVTVSGLLMGQDVVPALRQLRADYALLPRVMFDDSGTRTLDEYSPDRIAQESGMGVRLAGDAADLVAVVRELGRLVHRRAA